MVNTKSVLRCLLLCWFFALVAPRSAAELHSVWVELRFENEMGDFAELSANPSGMLRSLKIGIDGQVFRLCEDSRLGIGEIDMTSVNLVLLTEGFLEYELGEGGEAVVVDQPRSYRALYFHSVVNKYEWENELEISAEGSVLLRRFKPGIDETLEFENCAIAIDGEHASVRSREFD